MSTGNSPSSLRISPSKAYASAASCSDTRGAQMSRTSCSQSTLRRDKRSRFPSHSTAKLLQSRHKCACQGLSCRFPGTSQQDRSPHDQQIRQTSSSSLDLRAEFVDAITRGRTSSDSRSEEIPCRWRTFSVGVGTLLPCDRDSLERSACGFSALSADRLSKRASMLVSRNPLPRTDGI